MHDTTCPVAMSGANSQPTDLREYSMGTYVRR